MDLIRRVLNLEEPRPGLPLFTSTGSEEPQKALDFRIDLADALEKIGEPVLKYWLLDGMTRREAQRAAGVGKDQFRVALGLLRERLQEYDPT